MGVTAVVVGATALATSAGIGVANYIQGQQAADAAKSLADQQARQLKNEQDAAAAQAAAQATTGQTFGFSNQKDNVSGPESGFGFAGIPAVSPNSGRGQITGMG